MQDTLRVHLVDDDCLTRLGMERLLESQEDIELESVSSTGNRAVEDALALEPDVVLMETMVRDVDGVQAVHKIVSQAPHVKVAMVSSAMNFDLMNDAYHAGASSYLSKQSISLDFGAAIRMIHQGQSIFSMPPELQRFPVPSGGNASSEVEFIDRLSTRDQAILSELVGGRTNLQIAASLHVSEATVKAQITKMMVGLKVSGRVQLAVLAVKAGVQVS
jgi:DNA-binding NarL/FixJ family response regulator